jgi:hypothetical protein
MMKYGLFIFGLFAAAPNAIIIRVTPSTATTATAQPVSNGLKRTAIDPTAVICNQPMPSDPATGTVLVNPKTVSVEDPFHAGMACVVDMPLNLPNTPSGTTYKVVQSYEAASCENPIGQIVSPCEGSRSDAIPFFSVQPVPTLPRAPAKGIVK